MKKLIFISFSKVTQNLYDAMCINDFIRLGIEVEYLDVTSMLFGGNPISQDYSFIKPINSYNQLETYLASNATNETLYNVQISYEARFLIFFKLLKKYNCKKSIFEIGYLPSLEKKSCLFKYLKNPFHILKRIYEVFITKLYIKLELIDLNYSIRFTAGEVAFLAATSMNKQIKICQINFIDYENYVKYLKSNKKFENDKKYFVFLDIYLHKHEDHQFSKMGTKKCFDSRKYLADLNQFFTYLENQFNIEVIIAAHPKSNYILGEFEHRKIIKDRTYELIANAGLVLSHHSASISYAILNQKPLVFFYSNDIQKNLNEVFLYTDRFSKFLDMPLVNINTLNDTGFKIPQVNIDVYNTYKYNYLITKETEDLTNNQIIKKFIKDENVLGTQ